MNEIINIIKNEMENTEVLNPNMSGERKKQYVLEAVKIIIVSKWGEKYWHDKWRDITEEIIELFVYLSKNKFVININRDFKKKCLNCLPML